jgi:DNA-directed RNA polymerase specialized sigma24 family protein
MAVRLSQTRAVFNVWEMNDAELLAASARGDGDAFAVFYRRHLPTIVGYCLRVTGDLS